MSSSPVSANSAVKAPLKAYKNMLIGVIIAVTFRPDGFGKQIHPVGAAAQGNFPKHRKIFKCPLFRSVAPFQFSLETVLDFALFRQFKHLL